MVVDNPPFSIFTKVCRFFQSRNISFFLFAPHLTLLSPVGMNWTGIVCDARVTYENGACVDTSFVSNLFGDIRIMTAPDLLARIKNAAKTKRRLMDLPKYIYPDNVVSAALLGKIASYVKFEVRASECRRVRKLDNQKGGGVYGGGYLLSDKATARKIEAYEQAAKRAAVIVLELSEREKQIIAELE